MNLFAIIIIAVFSGFIVILLGEVIYLHSRVEYLERRFIDMRGNINYLFNELENKKC